ncbi:MAG: hypothetical protein NWE93_01585 [Candidatus Bathyarchaeota archaeon]|nr:hypothetical protein [Candidatus Bathyarchaeota archaeon]
MVKNADKQELVFVRYVDHVLYNRSSALSMQPQVREAIGWLIYECDNYITLCWDRDAGPPTLHGGDPKASGLVLLKSDILELQKLPASPELNLNCKQPKQVDEYAFRPSERKTHKEMKTK